MISSLSPRSAPGLMAGCTLIVSLVMLQGCAFLEKMFGNPDQFSHRPAMVMFAKPGEITSDGARLEIDMSKINIGGISLDDILDHARDWRLNVFTLNGRFLSGNPDYNTNKNIHLDKLPLDKMLRVDLDLHLRSSSEGPDAEVLTKSFLVLLHKYPED